LNYVLQVEKRDLGEDEHLWKRARVHAMESNAFPLGVGEKGSWEEKVKKIECTFCSNTLIGRHKIGDSVYAVWGNIQKLSGASQKLWEFNLSWHA
jgi:hypothetical protein